jgi:hypothetical protein
MRETWLDAPKLRPIDLLMLKQTQSTRHRSLAGYAHRPIWQSLRQPLRPIAGMVDALPPDKAQRKSSRLLPLAKDQFHVRRYSIRRAVQIVLQSPYLSYSVSATELYSQNSFH